MIYQAKVLRIDEPTEGEVTLQVGNVELACFAYSHPYGIKVGSFYQVELNLFDDYAIKEISDETEPSIVRQGNTFSYVITGRLNGRCLESGDLTFEDDSLLSDFGYLDGKIVAMSAAGSN